MPTGQDFLKKGAPHIGEKYVLGALAPKGNCSWKGPWDCAEFISWCVYQVTGKLYGCNNNHGNPDKADAYTGYWQRVRMVCARQSASNCGANTWSDRATVSPAGAYWPHRLFRRKRRHT